jgi:hypothetical protein
MELAQLVTFGVGDLRDIDEYMQPTGAAGGDYTKNRHRALDPDAPVVPPRDLDILLARQKGVKKRIDASRETSSLSPTELAASLVAANDQKTWRLERRIIEQRLERAEHKIGRLAR